MSKQTKDPMKTKTAKKQIAANTKIIAQMQQQIESAKTATERKRLNNKLVEFICGGGKK
jgi:hypothetical protein